MEKREKVIKQIEYVFTKEEAKKLQWCLSYCKHRWHSGKKLQAGDIEFIDSALDVLPN